MQEQTITAKARSFVSKLFGPKNVEGSTIGQEHEMDAMTDGLSISTLLGTTKRAARNRQQIFQKWLDMIGDPIVSTALRLHVTAALGGHETSGDVVFLEDNSALKGDKAAAKIVEEIRTDLTGIFNRIAYTVAFNGAGYGDAFGRVYSDGKNGVVDVYVDEIVHPSMVTAYERGNATVGFVVAAGPKMTTRLGLDQMARMKMPRMVYIPQVRAMEKAIKLALQEDDVNQLPILPCLFGGSFLDSAEAPYDALSTALAGLVGQRVLDSIDESMLTINMDSMTKEQQKDYMTNLKKILTASKARAEAAVASGKPVLSRIYNLMPVWGEKQLTALTGSLAGGGRGQSGTISIEDVLFHAKLLSGAIGIDLSMLGFAELLSGGLGDGGFFRTSAQAAERSRLLRVAMTEFFNQIIDIHTFNKYGVVYKASERPWIVNFYGSISSLESEKQHTKTEAMNTAAVMAQTLAQLRDLRLDDAALKEVLTKIMLLDEEQADLIVKGMEKSPAEDGGDGGFGGGGGGFGGGDDFGGDGAKPAVPGQKKDEE
jgi:hypothetical protein